MNSLNNLKIAIIGLGYVGLPLAMQFAKHKQVIGFDIKSKRVKELKSGIDINLEFSKDELKKSKLLDFTSNIKDIKYSNCYIITAPTPINKSKKPDLRPILNASRMIGKILKRKDLVIYESTVYPGCIEEECVKVLEKISKLTLNIDFFCGYSPERINPGDKKHNIAKVKKITSGSTPNTAKLVDDLYRKIITVGTYKAPSIKVAEAAKVIENTQRDLNIALINELSIIFNKLNINTAEVLKAAETKWNFLSFKPGLVGGHCIGVDPYYLTHKAKSIGYHPKIILAGRKLNDSMGSYIAKKLINTLKKKKIKVKDSKILIMGLTFKENCPDTRNSGVHFIINKLKKFKCKLYLHDPYVSKKEIMKSYKIYSKTTFTNKKYDAILVSVAHKEFKKLGIFKIKNLCKKNHVIFDIKNIYNSKLVDFAL